MKLVAIWRVCVQEERIQTAVKFSVTIPTSASFVDELCFPFAPDNGTSKLQTPSNSIMSSLHNVHIAVTFGHNQSYSAPNWLSIEPFSYQVFRSMILNQTIFIAIFQLGLQRESQTTLTICAPEGELPTCLFQLCSNVNDDCYTAEHQLTNNIFERVSSTIWLSMLQTTSLSVIPSSIGHNKLRLEHLSVSSKNVAVPPMQLRWWFIKALQQRATELQVTYPDRPPPDPDPNLSWVSTCLLDGRGEIIENTQTAAPSLSLTLTNLRGSTVQFKPVCEGTAADASGIHIEGDKMVPDLILICENMLTAEGLVTVKALSSKFFCIYSLLKLLPQSLATSATRADSAMIATTDTMATLLSCFLFKYSNLLQKSSLGISVEIAAMSISTTEKAVNATCHPSYTCTNSSTQAPVAGLAQFFMSSLSSVDTIKWIHAPSALFKFGNQTHASSLPITITNQVLYGVNRSNCGAMDLFSFDRICAVRQTKSQRECMMPFHSIPLTKLDDMDCFPFNLYAWLSFTLSIIWLSLPPLAFGFYQTNFDSIRSLMNFKFDASRSQLESFAILDSHLCVSTHRAQDFRGSLHVGLVGDSVLPHFISPREDTEITRPRIWMWPIVSGPLRNTEYDLPTRMPSTENTPTAPRTGRFIRGFTLVMQLQRWLIQALYQCATEFHTAYSARPPPEPEPNTCMLSLWSLTRRWLLEILLKIDSRSDCRLPSLSDGIDASVSVPSKNVEGQVGYQRDAFCDQRYNKVSCSQIILLTSNIVFRESTGLSGDKSSITLGPERFNSMMNPRKWDLTFTLQLPSVVLAYSTGSDLYIAFVDVSVDPGYTCLYGNLPSSMKSLQPHQHSSSSIHGNTTHVIWSSSRNERIYCPSLIEQTQLQRECIVPCISVLQDKLEKELDCFISKIGIFPRLPLNYTLRANAVEYIIAASVLAELQALNRPSTARIWNLWHKEDSSPPQHRLPASEGDRLIKQSSVISLRGKPIEKPVQYLLAYPQVPVSGFRGRLDSSTCYEISTHWSHIYGFLVPLLFLTFPKHASLQKCIKTLHLYIITTSVEMNNPHNKMYLQIAIAIEHFIHYIILLVYEWSFVRSFRYDWDHIAKLERECGMRTRYLPVSTTCGFFRWSSPAKVSNAFSRFLLDLRLCS